MANPKVEKLKTFGLRFADKIAVAVTAVLCLVFVFLALSRETVETTPDQLSQVANQAQQNISRPQDEKAILGRIEEDGMVLQAFGNQVAERERTKVDVRKFSLTRSFVKAEPGAGLIRDNVNDQLLAPYSLVVTPGRGGIPFAARDAAGNLQPPDPDEQNKMANMFAMGGYGDYGMPGMGGMGATAKKNVRQEQLDKRQEAVASKKQKATIAGGVTMPLPEEPASNAPQLVDFKTEIRGQRWVAVVGLLNNKQFRERFAKALKVPQESPESHPDYKRIEMERQAYDPVYGTWSDWELVDPAALDRIAGDIAYEEDQSYELTPKPVRLDPIVAYLPYLASGYWSGVHHGQLIPPEKLRELFAEEDEESPRNTMGMMGMMGDYGGMGEYGMMGDYGMGGGRGGMGEYGMMGDYGMGDYGMGDYGMGMGMGMGMGRPAGAGPEHMTEEETVMVRGLDYTVRAGTTYRYRLRVVVANPNYNREDVSPTVDVQSREFAGPWSEETEPVRVPADVAIYAMNPARGSAYRPETVSFDIAAWDSASGSLAVSNFPAAPGEFVGRPQQLPVAVEGEDQPQPKTINFQSRELVIDTMGGQRPVQDLALAGSFEIPAVVAVLKPDGTIALHNQAVDATDEQLSFMRESYRLSVSPELNKKAQGNDMGMMYGMGGYGG